MRKNYFFSLRHDLDDNMEEFWELEKIAASRSIYSLFIIYNISHFSSVLPYSPEQKIILNMTPIQGTRLHRKCNNCFTVVSGMFNNHNYKARMITALLNNFLNIVSFRITTSFLDMFQPFSLTQNLAV
jgi:hypothetical protein